MAEQPRGTVTMLFTDIEGSSRLLERLGPDRYSEALELHRRLLRDAFARHGGYEVDFEGDAFFVAFSRADEAVAAAAKAQQALAAAAWPEEGGIRVRMGLHTGEPLAAPPKYVGLDVHKAARIMAAGHGGQVLVSAATQRLVGESELVSLGEHRLKDLSQPEPLYQLRIPGLPLEFPALKTLANRPTNLPVVATPFIGREREVADVLRLLLRDDVRLLTLTGPGGIGKTRLGLQAAADVVERFRDGVYFVPLAAVRDRSLVVPTIAQTLGLREEAEALSVTLERYLREKQLLLLLDNFEQVIDAAAEIAHVLTAAPEIHILVTSREALRVAGEHLYDVPPLTLPAAGDDVGGVEAADGVQLFVARARAADHSFELTPQNASAVAEIVRQVEGLPLAVELAAARVRALAPAAIVTRLGSRLRLLTSGRREADERQQTLRAAIQWSYDLLTGPEQALFGRLSVFAGGCRLEDAEAVCDFDENLGIDVFDGVASLVEKSLLRRRSDPDGEQRYWMLETIREFAVDVLDPPTNTAVREQHARRFLAVAEDAERAAHAGEQTTVYERLDADRANLRAALAWAEEVAEHEVAVRLATALSGYWCARGHINEGLSRLEQAVRSAEGPPPRMLLALCLLRHLAACNAQAVLVDVRRALAALEEAEDAFGLAQAWNLVGRLQASGMGEISAGEVAWERALSYAERGGYAAERAESMGWLMVMAVFGPLPTSQGINRCETFLRSAREDPVVRAFASVELSVLYAMRGDFENARHLLGQGRDSFTELGLNVWAANTAQEGFYVEMLAGDPSAAEALLRESCQVLEAMGERSFLSTIAAFRAHALCAQGAYDEAENLSQQSEALAASDDVISQVLWRTARAKVHGQRSEFNHALALAREAVALAEPTEMLNVQADALTDLAELLLRSGSLDEGAATLDDAAERYEKKQNLVALRRTRTRVAALVHQHGGEPRRLS